MTIVSHEVSQKNHFKMPEPKKQKCLKYDLSSQKQTVFNFITKIQRLELQHVLAPNPSPTKSSRSKANTVRKYNKTTKEYITDAQREKKKTKKIWFIRLAGIFFESTAAVDARSPFPYH